MHAGFTIQIYNIYIRVIPRENFEQLSRLLKTAEYILINRYPSNPMASNNFMPKYGHENVCHMALTKSYFKQNIQ